MKLIVGLGNIGKNYENTRHNFGFILLDKIISSYDLQDKGIKDLAQIFTGQINSHKVIAIKPQTLMNLSGRAVIKFCNFYKIKVEDVLVLHDEIDIKLGQVKFKQGGGNAGHNGLKSIDEVIGKNYKRLRLGVGRPEDPRFEVSDFVLSKFAKDERKIVDDICDEYARNIEQFLN